MTNTEKLSKRIKLSGIKYLAIAHKLNISYQALRNKLLNKSEFLPSEISALCEILGIYTLEEKNELFFANDVE